MEESVLKKKSLVLLDALSFGLFTAYAIQQVASAVVRRPQFPTAEEGMRLVFFIPALNEAAVIRNTVLNLRQTVPDALCVVIDDASDDGTDGIVRELAAQDPGVRLLRRELPHARQNKAHAMNWAATQLLADGSVTGDLERTVFVGMDADGRIGEDFVLQVQGAFGDCSVMAAQNWMRYRQDVPVPPGWRGLLARTMLFQQDLEGFIQARTQFVRHGAGTAVLTGNGQCLRASFVADELAAGRTPWPEVLLEDFASTVEIKLRNSAYRVAYMDAQGEQQGMTEIGPFVRQRARWTQGTMECLPYLPRLWQANLSPVTVAEFSYLLLGPWMLPVTVLAGLSQPARRRLGWRGLTLPAAVNTFNGTLPVILQFYWAWQYRQDRQLPLWTVPYAVATLPLHGFLTTLALPVAYSRYFRGEKTWYKSVRQSEDTAGMVLPPA